MSCNSTPHGLDVCDGTGGAEGPITGAGTPNSGVEAPITDAEAPYCVTATESPNSGAEVPITDASCGMKPHRAPGGNDARLLARCCLQPLHADALWPSLPQCAHL